MDENFRESRKILMDAIAAVQDELVKKVSDIEQTFADVAAGKKDYNKFLDKGDEGNMSRALAAIRGANAKREELIAGLPDFEGKIAGLETKRVELTREAQTSRNKADEQLKLAEKGLEQAKENVSAAQGVHGRINELREKFRQTMLQFGSETTEAEASEKV